MAEEARKKKELAELQLKEKQVYLKRYYEELDRKFRGGRDDLFAGLKKLETNLLNWDKITEDIFTDDSVTITEGRSVIYGIGLKADQTFTNYEILNPIGSHYISD